MFFKKFHAIFNLFDPNLSVVIYGRYSCILSGRYLVSEGIRW